MYINTIAESTKFDRRTLLILPIVIVIGVAVLAAAIPAKEPIVPLSPWRRVDLGAADAQPLATPAVLPDAVIWRPLGDSALIYSHLSGNPQHRHDWLRGIPDRWMAWAAPNAIHMVWRDLFGQLWSAVLTPNGEQITAPIEIATGEVAEFFVIPLRDDRYGIFYRVNDTVSARVVSVDGRPLSAQFVRNGVAQFAVTGAEDTIHMAWREDNQLFAGQISLSANLLLIPDEAERLVTRFDLSPDAWVSSLNTLLVDDMPAVMWGISDSATPDRERYEGLILSDSEESSGQPFDLTLPDASGLRWAYIHQNRVTLSARINAAWRPVLVEMSAQGPQGFQVIDGPPATGGPVGFWDDHFAWVTVDTEGQPQIYATTLDATFGELSLPEDALTGRAALREGLRASPRLMLWLLAPIFVLIYRQGWWYAPPLATGLYLAGKWFISYGLFDVYPATLTDVGLRSGFLTGFLGLLAIQMAALGVGYIGWGRTPILVRHFGYFLTDAVLTFAIFGAGVE